MTFKSDEEYLKRLNFLISRREDGGFLKYEDDSEEDIYWFILYGAQRQKLGCLMKGLGNRCQLTWKELWLLLRNDKVFITRNVYIWRVSANFEVF